MSSIKLLLDTNALLWILAGDPRFAPIARQATIQADEVLVSDASLWEIAIKVSIKKLAPIPELYEAIRRLGFKRLHIEEAHLQLIQTLPLIHRDPFDRMLVAQAHCEQAALVTGDTLLKDYGIMIVAAL